MKSHQIFQNISPELGAEILNFLREHEKAVYKTVIQGLANQRNLRAIFVERKPRDERHAWMKAALSRPVSDTLATHLVQAGKLSNADRAELRRLIANAGKDATPKKDKP